MADLPILLRCCCTREVQFLLTEAADQSDGAAARGKTQCVFCGTPTPTSVVRALHPPAASCSGPIKQVSRQTLHSLLQPLERWKTGEEVKNAEAHALVETLA